jgi:acetyl esterase/lipase
MRRSDAKKLAPDLRLIGPIERALVPKFHAEKSAKMNRLMRKFMRGKWFGHHSVMREDFIERADGSRQRVLIVHPKGKANDAAPGLLWMHGGGYGIGIPELDFAYMDSFASAGNCVVVSPDYRLSCEAPYPAALEDCYLALKWMKKNAEKLGIQPDRLFVGGESAGGGLAAALAIYARDKKEVSIAYQMPFYPMLDDRMITPSSRDNRMPVWDSASNKRAWEAYLGSLYGKDNVPPYAAPSRETDYAGLPPCCTFAGTAEPFYDEIVRYVNDLKAAGVPVDFMEFEGCYHAFDIMAPFSKEAKAAKEFYMRSFTYAVSHYRAPQPPEKEDR